MKPTAPRLAALIDTLRDWSDSGLLRHLDSAFAQLARPEGEGCRVTFEQEVDSLGSFFGKLADPIVTKMYSRDVRGNLENLKILLEEA